MATAGALQQDSAGQKLAGPFHTDGTGRAQRGANVDSVTTGQADAAVVLYDTTATPRAVARNEDAAHVSSDPGIMALAVYKATAAQTAGTDGDYSALVNDANGRLHVVNSALEAADNAAFTAGTSPVVPIGAVVDDTSTNAATEDHVGTPRMSVDRILLSGAGVKTVTLMNANSPASATTVAQTAVTGLGPYRSMAVYANIQGGTGGTLDIYIQFSPDGGTTWVDYAHYAQLGAGASAITRVFTVSKHGQQTTLQTVGTGSSPALAASTIIGGDWGDRLRVVCVAGTSTSAGATQTILAVLSS